MKAVNIKVEHLMNPLGISVEKPWVSWICENDKSQVAYEIEARCDGEQFWNSGKVYSHEMCAQIEKEAVSRQRITFQIRLWNEEDECGEWSEEAWYEMGLLNASDFVAKWINPELECDPEIHKPASYLKKFFEISKDDMATCKVARTYITAHGLYELFLNGKRVGDFVLAPGSSNYEKQICYQTYDVKELLQEGANEVTVVLGDGWYRSVSGVDGNRNIYGSDVALYLQLELDGKAICISDETWMASQMGPLRENDMQQGETYDARLEEIKDYHEVVVTDDGTDKLVCSNAVGIKEKERFEGKIITAPNGETVIDFGQNLAGYIEFSLSAHEGDTITLMHGETLDENGNFTQENFQDRKRHKEGGTKQQVTYICKEGENHYKSKFTIWGFRYALVQTNMDLSNAKFYSIAVYSDMEETAKFTCGNDDLNRLYENCIWSMKSNFCDVPTDCPTRERAAWTGDMGVFVDTGMMLMDSYSVIEKWLQECRLAQYEDGRVSNIAPRNNNPSFFSGLLAGSVGWGDACIIVPYALYKKTGDKKILEENYSMMKSWYGYLQNRAKKSPKKLKALFDKNPYKKYTINTGIDYGEWCEPDVESTSAMRTPQEKVATAYFSYSGKLLSEIALILGNEKDAKFYHAMSENAKLAYREIATNQGRIESDRQAEYIRAITFDLLAEQEKIQAAADLNDLVIRCGYQLNTGFLSTPDLCRVLSDYGYTDTAYQVLLNEKMPGWLYEVKKGATTIWEVWDGIDENGKPKESLNHYSKGAIAGWMLDGICGIQVLEQRIVLKPHPNTELGFASASYDSQYGTITSQWKYVGDKVHYEFTLPENCSAEVVLPDGTKQIIYAGKTEIER